MSRLVVSVANPRGLLWQAPILSDRVAAEKDLTRVQLPAVRAVSPRFGPGYLLYQSSKGGSDGLWKLQDREAVEIWRPSDAFLAAPAAVSPDGKRLCLTLRQGERHSLHLLSAEGTGMRAIAESLNVVDTPSWSPDGRFLTVAANNDGLGGRVYRVPVDPADGLPEKLTDDHAYNPVWSPDGGMILYYHSEQSATFRLKAVSPGKRSLPIPEVKVRGEGGRFRFMPGGKAFVALLGPFRDQNFYLVDLVTGTKRQLTQMTSGSSIRNFDISPDGRRIIFDRIEENSDVVLIDLAPRTAAVSPRP
jgi:dipeptidyl aminopeptidase/acylaminoacyl peptidase